MLSSTELQSPPVIQMMAGCFLPSLGSGDRYAESWPTGAVNFVLRNNWAGGLGSGSPGTCPACGFVLKPARASASDCLPPSLLSTGASGALFGPQAPKAASM